MAAAIAQDPAVAAVAFQHPDWDPGRTWFVFGVGLAGVRKLLSAHYSRGGQLGADAHLEDLAAQGFEGLELADATTGRRWRR